MSMPVVRKHRWTLAEVEQLIAERPGLAPRYELLDGELLVTPAPSGRHQRIILELAVRLHAYVNRCGLGEVRLGPGDIDLAPEAHFEPDLFVIPSIDGRRPPAEAPVTRLLLAVEVLSPGSVRHDRITKRRFFLTHGVPEYWIVDGDAELFEVWRPGDERPAVLDETLSWRATAAPEAFELDMRELFGSVADE
jgi:Uma2 family endonuclease